MIERDDVGTVTGLEFAHDLLQLLLSAGKTRHDRADGNVENLRDLLVGMFLQIKEHERRPKGFVDRLKRVQDLAALEAIDRLGLSDGQFGFGLGDFLLGPEPRDGAGK
jgi:hypothetical protein